MFSKVFFPLCYHHHLNMGILCVDEWMSSQGNVLLQWEVQKILGTENRISNPFGEYSEKDLNPF